jgi:hypothetical protein
VKLDTRTKILPLSRAAEFADAAFVAMHLDPLTVEHARRLAKIAAEGRRVVVLLSDPPAPLLPLAARAELAASLESVSAVMIIDGAVPMPVIAEELADLDRRDALIRHVWQRHAAGAR